MSHLLFSDAPSGTVPHSDSHSVYTWLVPLFWSICVSSSDTGLCVTIPVPAFLLLSFHSAPRLVLGNPTVHWPPYISHVHLNALTPSFPNKQFIIIFSCLVCVTIQHLVLIWAYENHLPKSMGISFKSRANARFCIWLFLFDVWIQGTIIWLLISVCF